METKEYSNQELEDFSMQACSLREIFQFRFIGFMRLIRFMRLIGLIRFIGFINPVPLPIAYCPLLIAYWLLESI